MAQTAEQWGVGVDVIVPVPLHPVRLRERGYNQSELLAREVAETVGVPVRAGVLRRCRATEAQSSLGLADRGPNVQSAFIAVEAVDGSRVMLIDDVFSSGHTASACAGALLLGGARRVYVLTAAMAVLDFGPGAMEV